MKYFFELEFEYSAWDGNGMPITRREIRKLFYESETRHENLLAIELEWLIKKELIDKGKHGPNGEEPVVEVTFVKVKQRFGQVISLEMAKKKLQKKGKIK